MAEYITPNGKTIVTYLEPETALLRIKFTSGGELPLELSGMFTSSVIANKVIEGYLAKLPNTPKKVTKDK